MKHIHQKGEGLTPHCSWKEDCLLHLTMKVRDDFGATTKDIYMVLTGRPIGIPFQHYLLFKGKEKTIEYLETIIKKNI